MDNLSEVVRAAQVNTGLPEGSGACENTIRGGTVIVYY